MIFKAFQLEQKGYGEWLDAKVLPLKIILSFIAYWKRQRTVQASHLAYEIKFQNLFFIQ